MVDVSKESERYMPHLAQERGHAGLMRIPLLRHTLNTAAYGFLMAQRLKAGSNTTSKKLR